MAKGRKNNFSINHQIDNKNSDKPINPPTEKLTIMPFALPRPIKKSSLNDEKSSSDILPSSEIAVKKPLDRNKKIQKNQICKCSKKNSIENFIKLNANLKKSIDRTKIFWSGRYVESSLVFKKKFLVINEEDNSTHIDEEIDFSHRIIWREFKWIASEAIN